MILYRFHIRLILGLIFLLGILPISTFAQDTTSSFYTDPSTISNRVLSSDKLNLKILLKNEYRQLNNDLYQNRLTLEYSQIFKNGLSSRLTIPYIWTDIIDNTPSKSGLGDLQFKLLQKVYERDWYGLSLGSEIYFNTAGEPGLGAGQYQFVPSLEGTILVNERTALSPILRYFYGFDQDDNIADIRRLRLKLILKNKWSKGWSTAVQGEFYFDLNDQTDRDDTLFLEFDLNRQIHQDLNIYLRPGIRAYGDMAQKWNIELGIRYIPLFQKIRKRIQEKQLHLIDLIDESS